MFDKRNVKNLYALTPLQEGILFHSLMDQGGATYFEQACFNVKGEVNIPLFEQAWNELIKRHDILRTIFVLKNVPQPLQVVLKQRELKIDVRNITHLDLESQSKEIEDFRVKDRYTPFDFAKDLLVRVTLFNRGDGFYTLVWSFHHIIMDGWSVSVLYEELATIYTALIKVRDSGLSQGRNSDLPQAGNLGLSQNRDSDNKLLRFNLPEPIQFNAYIKWLKGRNNKDAQAFWQKYLDGYSRLTGLPRLSKLEKTSGNASDSQLQTLYDNQLQPLESTFSTKRVSFEINPEISKGLSELSLKCQVTMNIVFQALWGLVMSKYNKCSDALFGITVSGRPAEIQGIERMVGLFINAVPVRVKYSDSDTFKDLLARLQNEATSARDFHYYSLADIQASTSLRQNLFDQLLVFENYPDPSDVVGGSEMGLSLTDFDQFEQTNYDLTVEVFHGETLAYEILFNPAVFAEDVVNKIQIHLERAAISLLADETIKLGTIEIFTPEEEKQYNQYIQNSIISSDNLNRKDIADENIESKENRDRRILAKFIAPENDIEQKLAEIWQEILERSPIGIDDNFFEVGGHSLRATRIISRIHKVLSVEITLQEFFRNPDIRTLANLVQTKLGLTTILKKGLIKESFEKNDSNSSAIQSTINISKTNISKTIPLSPVQADYETSHSQRRLWILDKMEDNFTAYNQSAGFLFEGSFNPELFRQAVEFVAARHESLRTVFVEKDNQPRQKILDSLQIPFTEIDLSREVESEKEARNLAAKLPHQIFDLANGPLWSVTLLRLSSDRYVLLLNMHHIICDGWSLVVLENEVLSVYKMLVQGIKPNIKLLPLQYKDFAAWQNRRLESSEMVGHKNYWHSHLGGEIPVLNLPTDFPRPLVRTYNGAIVRSEIPATQVEEFTRFCNQNRISLFTGLTAILKVLLFRYTGQQDIIIGSPVAGRDHTDLEEQIGFFVNTVALRDRLEPDMQFTALLKDAAQTITNAFDHQIYPFDRLVEELNVLRDVGRSPIFDVMLVLQNNIQVTSSVKELTISEFNFPIEQSQFDLTLIFSEGDISPTPALPKGREQLLSPSPLGRGQGGRAGMEGAKGLTLDINYNTDLFRKETIWRMAGHFNSLLESVLKQPETQISRLNILTQDEEKTLKSGFNITTRDFPEDKTLATLFEEQVVAAPDNIAAIYQDVILSYKYLNQYSNLLGFYLRESFGIVPDTPVGVLLNRSHYVPVALIGVLKAGGVFLPLDPESPLKRLQYIVKDSKAKIVITDKANLELAKELDPNQIINIEENFCLTLNPSSNSTANLAPVATPTDLAYIIYTSGSTGEPKGVMVEHRSFINMILAQIEGFDVKPDDRVLQFATLMFDASMSEIFMALLCGAAVVMIDKEQIQDTTRFIDYMENKEISVITLPPVYLKMLNRHPFPKLRVLITAGEPAIKEDALFYGRTKNYFNAYGPTETAVCTSFHKVNPDAFYGDTIPVGSPIANNAVFIVDQHLNPVPIGVAGELCFAGVGVARGYLNRPELTSQKFISNPFSPTPLPPPHKERGNNITPSPVGRSGEGLCVKSISKIEQGQSCRIKDLTRMYRIGDLGKWLPTGDIEFLGRVDEQVKIRGFRIEPGEIASALKTFAGIEDALVTVWQDESEKNNHLAAYIVTKSKPLSSELRRHLSERVPAYMIPTVFISLKSFPMTINGKIDKRALPNPAQVMQEQIEKNSNKASSNFSMTSLEKEVLKIWQTLFNRKDISSNDDFFNLGGDSIKAIRMVALLRENGFIVKVKDIFKWTTISELAKYGVKEFNPKEFNEENNKDGSSKEISIIKNIDKLSGDVVQTPIYRWFFDHFKNYASHFNHADLFYSQTELDPDSLYFAVNAVVEHHDMLRLACKETTKGIQLFIPPESADLKSKIFQVVDLRHLPLSEAASTLSRIANDAQCSFDLFKQPLFKAIHFQLADGDRLFIVMHHLLGDAVSWRIILEDLESAYNQHFNFNAKSVKEKLSKDGVTEDSVTQKKSAKELIELPYKTDYFATWALALEKYASSDALQSEKQYWLEVIQQPFGRLPSDFSAQTAVMADMDIVEIQWDIEKTRQLRQIASNFNKRLDVSAGVETNFNKRAGGVGLDRFLLAALAWSCHCQHGHSSTLISLESYGRPELFDDIDVSRTVGWFTATYLSIISINANRDAIESISAIDKALKVVPNNGIGWGLLKYLTPLKMGLYSDINSWINRENEPYPEINFNYLGEFEAYSKDMFKQASEETGSQVASGVAIIHDLDINGAIADGKLQIIWNYNTKRFAEERIRKMVNDFSNFLETYLLRN
ncbi:MAG: amino acid adenylation domain-containing protein [Desulfamplus sp.]|nr:amino acid adenylation domain-containing protein [Desulfamplus sp.]